MELLSAGKVAPGGSSGDMDRFRHNTASYEGIVSLLSSASSIKSFIKSIKFCSFLFSYFAGFSSGVD